MTVIRNVRTVTIVRNTRTITIVKGGTLGDVNIYGGIADLNSFTTDDLDEGNTNLYLTTARVQAIVEGYDFLTAITGQMIVNALGYTPSSFTWDFDYDDLINKPTLLSLGNSSSTAHRGDHGVVAYNHSQLTSGNPHAVTRANLGIEFDLIPITVSGNVPSGLQTILKSWAISGTIISVFGACVDAGGASLTAAFFLGDTPISGLGAVVANATAGSEVTAGANSVVAGGTTPLKINFSLSGTPANFQIWLKILRS